MKTITQLRKEIRKIDDDIIENIHKRNEIAKKIGLIKKKEHLKITDKSQENELIEYHDQLAEKYAIDKKFIKHLFDVIIEYSKKLQHELLK